MLIVTTRLTLALTHAHARARARACCSSGRFRSPLLQYPAPSIFGIIADPLYWRHRSRLFSPRKTVGTPGNLSATTFPRAFLEMPTGQRGQEELYRNS
jgi:hypothetical protein